MAIYRQSVQTLSRSTGRSAVAAAAYRSAGRLVCKRRGTTHDFRRKRGVTFTAIVAPGGVHLERERLWNAVEAAETRVNSVVAREWTIALPHELDEVQRRDLVMRFVRVLVDRYKIVADLAIHDPAEEPQKHRDEDADREFGHDAGPDPRNFHAHILTGTREYVGGYEFGSKVRLLDGKKSGAAELVELREIWADLCNDALEAAGSDARVDHRSNAARGILQASSGKLGLAAVSIERRSGTKSDRRIYLEEQKAEIEAGFVEMESPSKAPVAAATQVFADEGHSPTGQATEPKIVRPKGIGEAPLLLVPLLPFEHPKATNRLARRASRRNHPIAGGKAVAARELAVPTSTPRGTSPRVDKVEIAASQTVRPSPDAAALAAVREGLAALRRQAIVRDANELEHRLRSLSVHIVAPGHAENLSPSAPGADVPRMHPGGGENSAMLADQAVQTDEAPRIKLRRKRIRTLSPRVPLTAGSSGGSHVQRTKISIPQNDAYGLLKTGADSTAEKWFADDSAGNDVVPPRDKLSPARIPLPIRPSSSPSIDAPEWTDDDMLGIHAVGLALLAVEMSDNRPSAKPIDVVRRATRVVASAIGIAEHKLLKLAVRFIEWIVSSAERRAGENQSGVGREYGIWLSRLMHHAKASAPGPVEFSEVRKLTRAQEESLMAVADRFADAIKFGPRRAPPVSKEQPRSTPSLKRESTPEGDNRRKQGPEKAKRGGSGLND